MRSMLDPVAYREEEINSISQPLNKELENSENLNQPSSAEISSSEDAKLEAMNNKYLIISDNEVVELQSNLLLPSGLRVYNES